MYSGTLDANHRRMVATVQPAWQLDQLARWHTAHSAAPVQLAPFFRDAVGARHDSRKSALASTTDERVFLFGQRRLNAQQEYRTMATRALPEHDRGKPVRCWQETGNLQETRNEQEHQSYADESVNFAVRQSFSLRVTSEWRCCGNASLHPGRQPGCVRVEL
jgi:hypothetical protein